MLCTQPNSIKAISSIKARPDYAADQVKKRCSIVLFTNRDNSNVYNYLRSLSTSRLSSQYEFLIINNSQVLIDESHIKPYMDNVKIIRPPVGLKFVELCILAAQQAKGEYVIFTQLQLDENGLNKTIDQIETLKMKIATPEERNYILVNRMDFLNTGSFEGLTAKQENEPQAKEQQSYHYALLSELNKYADVRGKKVLVVGCNRGLECNLLIQMGAKEVTGLDVIEEVGKDYPHPRIRYVRYPAEAMPFEDNSFDISSSIATLEHIPNPRAALEQMAIVTARRGVLYCYAAPLWNSAFGHHKKDIFPNEPWIHLRKINAEGMKSYYKDLSEQTTDPSNMEAHIDYIYSDGFNQTSIREYKSIVTDLFRITSPIHIELGLNYKNLELLKPDILSELKDYSEDELLTGSLKLILRKV